MHLSSYYDASGDTEALRYCIVAFMHVIEEHTARMISGYLEAFDQADFQPVSQTKSSQRTVFMAEKTMNTLLHVFEGLYGACISVIKG